MDTSPYSLVKVLIPKLPFMLKTAALHSLWLSDTSSKWDLKSELIIKTVRYFLHNSKPEALSKMQHLSIKDPGVKGPMWISRVTMPAPEEGDVRQALSRAIDGLKEGGETYTAPELRPVEGEWTGYRANVSANAPEPSISEDEKYASLMKEPTLNQAFSSLMDPGSHRVPCSHLAKKTKGRCFNIRYRLAPQNPFPAALLDGLVAYLSLLHPPPGSLHEPVPASSIVFSGDSAGGGLSLSLLQALLELHRQSSNESPPTITWHGSKVPVPLPAGVAANSGWFDLTRCMPSLETNAKFDYLPPPSDSAHLQFPKCPIWPADPPRGDFYTDTSALCHPLVSPVAAKSWEGAPPMWIMCGEEMLADENKVLAQQAASQGVTVVFEQYEAMPHCFSMMLMGLGGSKKAFESWTGFITACVERPDSLTTKGIWVEAKTLNEKDIDVTKASTFDFEEVMRMMKESRERRVTGNETEAKAMPKL
ncbi:MAG: hypothetical protein M1812_004804 [Candelaria pacifica]|nr:MAG: hypothetical protein M1812_004804 [Candelaria pacifica]